MLAVPTDAVAFLDDDDVLSTDSLALRIQEMEKLASGTPLLICGQAQLALPNGQMTEAVPKVLHNSDKDVADYLFAKRSLNPTRNAIFTPTIMVNRQLADLVSWNVELPRHQDWDFVLACQAAGARIVQISHVVAHCAVGSNGSISASSDWLNSLTWVDSVGKNMSPRTSAGLLVSVPLRFALQARSLSGVRLVLVRLAKGRSWPSLSPLLVGLAGMIPRRSLEYAAGTFTRIKHFLKGSRTKNLR